MALYGITQDHDSVYQGFKGFYRFCDWDIRSPLENFLWKVQRKMEARELEHPILFDGVSDYWKISPNQGGRHFLVSHRNNQVLEILEKNSIAAYFTEVVTSNSRI